MKYLLASASAALLVAGAAIAQPVASAGGAAGSAPGQTVTGTVTNPANTPPAPAAPVDQSLDHANHTAGGATVNAEKPRDKKPGASVSGGASSSTDDASRGSATANTGANTGG